MSSAAKPDEITRVEPEIAESVSTEGTVEEEEECFFQDIYLLAEQSISVPDIEKMRSMGINTLKGVQMTTATKLAQLEGFDVKKVKKIQEICQRISINNRFMTALEVCEERRQVFRINTGSENLDVLLGGGVESMAVTQVFGESGTGKTQIAHTLCVTAQIPHDGYPGGKVMFIDTEHKFRPERIRQVACRFDLDEKQTLGNVLYARAYSSDHQYELIKKVATKFHEEVGVFKLLIVDSIMALFRVDFMARELLHRQQKVGQMMSLLQKISEEYNIAVFITNQITSEMKYSLLGMNTMDDTKPVGGNILAHSSTTKVALKKVGGNVRIAKLIGSPELEEREEAFLITTGGIKDPMVVNNDQN